MADDKKFKGTGSAFTIAFTIKGSTFYAHMRWNEIAGTSSAQNCTCASGTVGADGTINFKHRFQLEGSYAEKNGFTSLETRLAHTAKFDGTILSGTYKMDDSSFEGTYSITVEEVASDEGLDNVLAFPFFAD
eukprot:Colp12_sorted_trinity150504_noHs@20121